MTPVTPVTPVTHGWKTWAMDPAPTCGSPVPTARVFHPPPPDRPWGTTGTTTLTPP
jgi:hypothetical protein